jgi:hypothetical protein
MDKRFGVAIATLLLVGCQSITHYELRNGDPASAQVAVVGDNLVVGREPLRIVRPVGQAGSATWTLPTGGQFDGQGIRFEAQTKEFGPADPPQARVVKPLAKPIPVDPKLFPCVVEEKSRAKVVCTIAATVKPGLYTYTVEVTPRPGVRILLDPTVMIE